MTIDILSKEETRCIQLLIERRNSLYELILILDNPSDYLLLEKAQIELKAAESEISDWWKNVLSKYERSINDSINYNINFFTCELYTSID